MSGFWNPARMEDDKQLELDKRVILGIAKDKSEKELIKVQKKIDKDTEKQLNIDVFSISRKQRASMNVRRDNLAFEKETILRRLSIINEELKVKINE